MKKLSNQEKSSEADISPLPPDAQAQALISELEEKWQQVSAEIHNYPSPIPACDAQFNYLLEQRGKLAKSLNELREIRDRLEAGEDQSETFAAFLEKAGYLSED